MDGKEYLAGMAVPLFMAAALPASAGSLQDLTLINPNLAARLGALAAGTGMNEFGFLPEEGGTVWFSNENQVVISTPNGGVFTLSGTSETTDGFVSKTKTSFTIGQSFSHDFKNKAGGQGSIFAAFGLGITFEQEATLDGVKRKESPTMYLAVGLAYNF